MVVYPITTLPAAMGEQEVSFFPALRVLSYRYSFLVQVCGIVGDGWTVK